MVDAGGGNRYALLGGETYRLLCVVEHVGVPDGRIALCVSCGAAGAVGVVGHGDASSGNDIGAGGNIGVYAAGLGGKIETSAGGHRRQGREDESVGGADTAGVGRRDSGTGQVGDAGERQDDASSPQLAYVTEAEWDVGKRAFLAIRTPRESSAGGRDYLASRSAHDSGACGRDGKVLLNREVPQGTDAPQSADAPGVNVSSAPRELLGAPAAPTPVTSSSPDSAKLRLFRSIFCADVKFYAHGYLSRKTGKIGYTPACANEWKPGVCSKPRVRCVDCSRRELLPLTDAALVAHFRGERANFTDVVGIYPMDEDSNVRFLAIDLDGDGWRAAASSLRLACEAARIEPVVERSRSGSGAHLWLFFSGAVPASLARRLGASLLTAAMARGGVGFDSYDRMFPAQDTLPANGFGNLIALPLQGRAMRSSNSCFIDASLKPFADQWAFLSSVRLLSEGDVKGAIRALGGSPLGRLVSSPGLVWPSENGDVNSGCAAKQDALAFIDAVAQNDGGALAATSHNSASPMLQKVPDADSSTGSSPGLGAESKRGAFRKATLSRADFPSEVHIALAQAVFIEKAGLSPRAQDAIRRLAAFSNSEFYRAQAMRQSVFGKPRIIYYGYEDERAIALPRGCREEVVKLIEEAGPSALVHDERERGRSIKAKFTGELRPDQHVARQALLAYDDGILVAPTAFGKTVLAASLIAERSCSTLVIMQSAPLLSQWRERLEGFLNIEDDRPPLLTNSGRPSKRKRSVIGVIGGGKDKPSGIVDLALVQALFEPGDIAGLRKVKGLVRGYGMVIVDECQHAAAGQTRSVLGEARARYVYGLTATPKRNDGQTPAVPMMCGPIRHVASVREQVERQGFRRFMVPRFLVASCGGVARDASLAVAMDAVCADAERNKLIVADVCAAMDDGRTPLVLTRRVAHAHMLAAALETEGRRVVLLIGNEPRRVREGRLAELRDIPRGESFAVVATGSYVGEGFDERRFDVLFLASPVSFDSTVRQYVGRLHRDFEGKRDVRVYDYVDLDVDVFAKMYRRRLRTYAHEEYEVLVEECAEGSVASSSGFSSVAKDGLKPASSMASAGSSLRPRLVGGEGAASLMLEDIAAARHSILVASDRWSNAYAGKSIGLLGEVHSRGVTISVWLRKPTAKHLLANFGKLSSRLTAAGGEVVATDACAELVIIDESLVWYGTVAPLAKAKDGDCSLRMTSPAVASVMAAAFGDEKVGVL